MASKTNTDKFEAGAVSFIFSIVFWHLAQQKETIASGTEIQCNLEILIENV